MSRPDAVDHEALMSVGHRLRTDGVLAALVIGSVGRGDATTNSDLDLLAVLPRDAEDRFERLLFDGRLVEVVGKSESAWRAHLTSDRPRWIWTLVGPHRVLYDNAGVTTSLQDQAKRQLAEYRTPAVVKTELATLLWHSKAKLERAMATDDERHQSYWAGLVFPDVVDALLALHDRPTPPGSQRLTIFDTVSLDADDDQLVHDALTGAPRQRLSAVAELVRTLGSRLGPPDLERLSW